MAKLKITIDDKQVLDQKDYLQKLANNGSKDLLVHYEAIYSIKQFNLMAM